MVEIYDRGTGKTHWLGSFHLAQQAARAYDIKSVHLYGAACRRNFPHGLPPLEPVNPQVATLFKRREDQEAREASRQSKPTRPTWRNSAATIRSALRQSAGSISATPTMGQVQRAESRHLGDLGDDYGLPQSR